MQGAYQSLITNPDIRWETRIQRNIGIDASLFSDRLSVSLDAYKSVSEDVLVFLPISQTTSVVAVALPLTQHLSPTAVSSFLQLTGADSDTDSPFKWGCNGEFHYHQK